MRELRVVGLGEDTSTVIFEDPIRHERFVVPSDERLRAAARGDIRRLGQMEIETTSPLRPRDIQARIRGGESVADVAAGAGVPEAHVERFAYPVLLERSRVAEMAGRGHPLTESGTPDPRTLLEILTTTFSGRGQDLSDGSWDAWKAEDGSWVVSLSWRTGHSDHLAHWGYSPGSSGGAVAPRDEPARDLLGLAPAPGPRRADGTAARVPEADDAEPVRGGEGGTDRAQEDDEDLGQGALAVGGGVTPTRNAGPARSAGSGTPARGGRGSRAVPDQRAPGAPDQRERRSRDTGRTTGTTRHRGESARPDASRPESRPEGPRTDPGRDDGGGDDPERGRGRARRRTHPIVPSWEDVLLGVRSPRS
jgi:hypothetical protein